MTTHIQSLPAGSGHFSSRPLWAAIAVLGVVVMALGATLIHVQTRPLDGHSVLVTGDPFAAEPQAASTPLPVNTVAPDETVVPARPAAATPATTPTDPQPDDTPTARPAATTSAADQDAGAAARAATATPDATLVPEAMPVAVPGTPAAPAPHVVTESGVAITGPLGQARARVYSTD